MSDPALDRIRDEFAAMYGPDLEPVSDPRLRLLAERAEALATLAASSQK
jgi:hypothetical protein